jgi:NADP-dependent 3-hydroxy acid dehydrogenase YdfG
VAELSGAGIDLSGRRILVTGASSGIGAAAARAVASCGASVALLARRADRLEGLRVELGERAACVAADVTDSAALERAVNEAAAALGGLDGVVASAGRTMFGAVSGGDPSVWRDMLDLNVVGPLATVRYALPLFPDEGRRDVVLIGSAAGLMSQPGVAIYSASKRGLQAAYESLRLELAPRDINTSIVFPGFFETEIFTTPDGITYDAEMAANDFPLFAPGGVPQDPAVLGRIIAFILSLPEGVAINEIAVRPTKHLTP